MVSEIQGERVLSETILLGLCDLTYSVSNPAKPEPVDEPIVRCYGCWGIWETVNGERQLTTECIENVIMMVPFSAVVTWTFGEKIGNNWKKILWQSGKIAFIFSISIEMLQLFLRLGTFQLSDLFYNKSRALGGRPQCGLAKAPFL